MATFMATHDVDDVDHWLKSPLLGEIVARFEGATVRKFSNPEGSNTTGVLLDVPDHLVPQMMEHMESEEVLEKEKADGVQHDTILLLVEA